MPRISEPSKIYLGIDPGASGGICYLDTFGEDIQAIGMPKTEADVWDLLSNSFLPRPNLCVIEKVGGFIGGKGNPGSAMFKFGASYGGLRMALIAAGIPFEEVTPQKWQKEFSLHKGKTESKTEWKNRLKSKAQQLFPQVKVTLAVADALLIAEFARRNY